MPLDMLLNDKRRRRILRCRGSLSIRNIICTRFLTRLEVAGYHHNISVNCHLVSARANYIPCR